MGILGSLACALSPSTVFCNLFLRAVDSLAMVLSICIRGLVHHLDVSYMYGGGYVFCSEKTVWGYMEPTLFTSKDGNQILFGSLSRPALCPFSHERLCVYPLLGAECIRNIQPGRRLSPWDMYIRQCLDPLP